MLTIAIERAKRFEKTIKTRNLMEIVAALAVTAIFAPIAWRAPNAVARTGNLVVAAGGLWIAFFMLRFGRLARPLPADRSLADYREALLAQFDHQIRLLRNVKFWYLLPLYLGLLIAAAGNVIARTAEGRPGWPELVTIPIFTAVFGFIWWLNEAYGVRKLRHARQRLLDEMHPPGL